MKKIITILLALLLVLLPQSALAVQVTQPLRQPVCSPEAIPLQSTEDMDAIEALLSGVNYQDDENKVIAWTDEDLGNVMYSKLLDDFIRDGEDTYLKKAGITYNQYSDSAVSVDLELVQQITRESYGLEFPTDLTLSWCYVVGDQVVIEIASGEGGEICLQECVQVGDTVLAVGTSVFHYGVGSVFEGHFLATLKKAPGSVYGYQLISVKPVAGSKNLQHLTAEASSELIEANNAHVAVNVLDNDLGTAWCESVKGVGIGEWIVLRSLDGSKMHISAVEFLLGYHKSEEHLYKNGSPWEMLIEAEGNYAQEVVFSDTTDAVLLTIPVETQWIKFTILDAEAGSKYEDTCITEIKLHGIDAEPHFRQYIADLPVEDTTEPTEPEATEPTSTEAETTEPTSTEAETTEPTSTEAEVTEPTATEPEETETTEDKTLFWELDKEDLSEDDPMEEDRKEEPKDDQTTSLLLVALIAASVVIVALLVVLIIVVIKKKK